MRYPGIGKGICWLGRNGRTSQRLLNVALAMSCLCGFQIAMQRRWHGRLRVGFDVCQRL